ncbi:molybdenum cofactor guanylyltransferase [Motilibacter aurantiacus]|uniref:molybdenum cofactor guanylyltransferase n=1 Tax=Motilibacter aurantiacus TaxID=2714955 RepID=UPI001407CA81|nr:NTP transferase domain-containing protein [Motilibacter aurantiacus]NHC44179.1 NTP transferase domain-containing protein [Motilibacter aurantiacus]
MKGGLPAYAAVVLAGGAARRMGGADKTAALVGGRPLLDRVLDAVASSATTVVVGPERQTSRPVSWAREEPPGGGPAAAVAAGVRLVTEPVVALLSADLPFLTPDAVDRLRRELGAGAGEGALYVDGSGAEQLLCGMWPTSALRAAVERAGEVDGLPLRRLLQGLPRVGVPAAGDGPAPWTDCDTPEQLARARRLAAGVQP